MREADPSRNNPERHEAKRLILREHIIGHAKKIAGALRFAGHKISVEPVTDENDEVNQKLKSHGDKLKNLFHYEVKGTHEAVDIFDRSIYQVNKRLEQLNEHKNVKRAAAAVIVAVAVYGMVEKIKSRRDREIPPIDHEG